MCPSCRAMKLLRLPPDGKVKAFVFCRHCKREQYLDIDLSLSQ
nr:MAG TPA: NUDIX domain protein [Caudoviricetes sp.]